MLILLFKNYLYLEILKKALFKNHKEFFFCVCVCTFMLIDIISIIEISSIQPQHTVPNISKSLSQYGNERIYEKFFHKFHNWFHIIIFVWYALPSLHARASALGKIPYLVTDVKFVLLFWTLLKLVKTDNLISYFYRF